MENVGLVVPDDIDIKNITLDMLSQLKWRTKEGALIRLYDMDDAHLRNASLMLIGMGFQDFNVPNDIKVAWLTAFRMEWERRKLARNHV